MDFIHHMLYIYTTPFFHFFLQTELTRSYIKPPPNKTALDVPDHLQSPFNPYHATSTHHLNTGHSRFGGTTPSPTADGAAQTSSLTAAQQQQLTAKSKPNPITKFFLRISSTKSPTPPSPAAVVAAAALCDNTALPASTYRVQLPATSPSLPLGVLTSSHVGYKQSTQQQQQQQPYQHHHFQSHSLPSSVSSASLHKGSMSSSPPPPQTTPTTALPTTFDTHSLAASPSSSPPLPPHLQQPLQYQTAPQHQQPQHQPQPQPATQQVPPASLIPSSSSVTTLLPASTTLSSVPATLPTNTAAGVQPNPHNQV